MSYARTNRTRGQRARRRAPRRFAQEVVQLGDTTAGLPQPLRRGVILWVRELLALVRLARRAFDRHAARALPSERHSR